MQKHYYALYCPRGFTSCARNPVGAKVMQFDSKEERAEVIAQLNNRYAGSTSCAAWAITAKDAGTYVPLQDFSECSIEAVALGPNGNAMFAYRSWLITH